MDFVRTGNIGLAAVTRGFGDRIGFTSPTTTYEKMRQIQSFAKSLDSNINQYISDPVFKSAWNAWYEDTWKPFYEKYAGPNASQSEKLGVLLYSDELASQTESYRRQLENFESDYSRYKLPNGQSVPNVPGTAPAEAKPALAQSIGLPWWFWFLGGVAFVGLGYYAYKRIGHKYKQLSSRDIENIIR